MLGSNARPLVTFALFSYNQEKFIRAALEGALSQQYEKLQFIFSDDCSKDQTFDVMSSIAAAYRGPHQVVLNRNAKNLGLSQHFSKIVNMAEGEFLVIAAGDDISLPGRTAKTVEMLTSEPDINFASFVDDVIDDEGVVVLKKSGQMKDKLVGVTLSDYLSGTHAPLSGASRGYRLSAIRKFGDLGKGCPTEDTPSVMRCLLHGRGLVSSEGGILYRRHSTNLSGPALLHSMPFEEIRKQYLVDLDAAKKNKLIPEGEAARVFLWVERNYRRRLIARDLYRTSFSLYYYVTNVAFSKDFTIREKLGMLRETLRGVRVRLFR